MDRGDVQRSIEFYSELSVSFFFKSQLTKSIISVKMYHFVQNNVQEIRRRKECEIDIMTAQIKNVDEVIN